MSTARVQNNFSNRAKARLTVERKAVFKSALENPFQVQWPSVPINLQNVCLARLLASLRPKRPRIGSCRADQVTDGPLPANATRPVSTSSDDNLVVGINQVTRTLECQIQSLRTLAVLPNSGSPPESLAAVFVCSADIDPPILVEHIPHLVASCNSFHHIVKQEPSKVKLVPLPKGSEQAVAQAVGIRRAAVIGVPRNSAIFASLKDVLDGVPDLMAPWLSSELPQQQLVPTHIKQLRTTCPKDMRAAKEKRVLARREAKQFSRPASRRRKLILSTDPAPRPN